MEMLEEWLQQPTWLNFDIPHLFTPTNDSQNIHM